MSTSPQVAVAAPAPAAHRVHRAWWVLVGCCLMYGGIVGIVGNSAGIYLKPVSTDMGWSLASLNSYLTVVSLVMTATLPVAGWVLPRVRIELALALALTLGTGTYAASAAFTALAHWYLAGVLLGISFGFLLYVPVPLVLNSWFNRRNGLALGLTAAFASAVAAAANPIGGALIESVGWRETRLIMGSVAFVMSVPAVLLLVRNRPESLGLRPYGAGAQEAGSPADPAVAPTTGAAARDLRGAVRSLPFCCLVLLAGLFAFGASMLQQTPSHAAAVGLDATTGATGVSAIMIGGILGKIGLGQLHDRRGVVVTTLVSAALGVLGPVVVILAAGHVAGFFVGCFLFGGAYAGLVVVPALAVRHFFGTTDFSRLYSLVTVSLGLFSAAAPVLYARIYDVSGSFDGSWTACAAAYVLVAVLMLVATRSARASTGTATTPRATSTIPSEGARP